ncbi:MAG: hypothetical protein WEB06_03350 [Actinomycetota bacterium]
MTPLRRKSPEREAFRRVVSELDAAQRVLLSAIPTSRDPGSPLKPAIEEFLAGLGRAEASMAAWRNDRTEPIWTRCTQALMMARIHAERMRDDPASARLGFEPLNARLGDIVSPLEEFADAAEEIRRLH